MELLKKQIEIDGALYSKHELESGLEHVAAELEDMRNHVGNTAGGVDTKESQRVTRLESALETSKWTVRELEARNLETERKYDQIRRRCRTYERGTGTDAVAADQDGYRAGGDGGGCEEGAPVSPNRDRTRR